MDIAELRRQHDELELLAGQLLEKVREKTPQRVATIRWRLARVLIAHLSVEDRHLYPAMIASGGRAQQVATAFKDEMGGLAQEFSAYMGRWTDQDIRQNWSRFADDTEALLGALAQRIARENKQLYPLLPVPAPPERHPISPKPDPITPARSGTAVR